MNINNLPIFWCGDKKLTNAELQKLDEMVAQSKEKWDVLRKKYPGKTTREILNLTEVETK